MTFRVAMMILVCVAGLFLSRPFRALDRIFALTQGVALGWYVSPLQGEVAYANHGRRRAGKFVAGYRG
jgi:hypothetical protein